MKKEEAIRKIIERCESHILCDIEYGELGKGGTFDFYGELNTNLITVQGLRKVLLWVLDEQRGECIRIEEVGKI